MIIENSYRPFKVAILMTICLFSNTKSYNKFPGARSLRKRADEPNLKTLEFPQWPVTPVCEFFEALRRRNPTILSEDATPRTGRCWLNSHTAQIFTYTYSSVKSLEIKGFETSTPCPRERGSTMACRDARR